MDDHRILLNDALQRMLAVARITNRLPKCYGEGIVLFPTEIHMIEAIELHPDSNTTSLSILFDITKGSVSKMLTKLCNKGYIERYQHAHNKKEIYFKLTELGRKAHEGHLEYHGHYEDAFYSHFSQYTDNEKELIINFINEYTENIRSMVGDEEIEEEFVKGEDE